MTEFTISADRCPQTLCRVLGLFAQQDRLIDYLEAVALPLGFSILIRVNDLDEHRAAIIAEKIRQMISVRSVQCGAVQLEILR